MEIDLNLPIGQRDLLEVIVSLINKLAQDGSLNLIVLENTFTKKFRWLKTTIPKSFS